MFRKIYIPLNKRRDRKEYKDSRNDDDDDVS